MRRDQLIEYKMRNIFLEKSLTKCGEGATPRPYLKFLKKQKEVWN